MNTRLTRTLTSVTFGLAVLCGFAFIGTGVSHMLDDGAVCVQSGFWANASLGDVLPVAEGVKASSSAVRLCQDSPSTGQRAADLGIELPWLLFGSLALLLFSRLLEGVQKLGPFTEEVLPAALRPRLVRRRGYAADRADRRLFTVLARRQHGAGRGLGADGRRAASAHPRRPRRGDHG